MIILTKIPWLFSDQIYKYEMSDFEATSTLPYSRHVHPWVYDRLIRFQQFSRVHLGKTFEITNHQKCFFQPPMVLN